MATKHETAEQVIYPGAEKVDWLKGWGVIELTADPDKPKKIEEEKDHIRWYVRGYLEEYSEKRKKANEEPYTFEKFGKFEFIPVGESRTQFRVNAVLVPPARKGKHDKGNEHHHDGPGPIGGTHLIPPPPPPPGKVIGS